ncbi:MAG: histidine ammonia-lyase [Bacteroidota bacterium]
MTHLISSQSIRVQDIESILNKKYALALSDDAKNKINTCRAYLDEAIRTAEKPIYGINTGFGSLCNVKINEEQLEQLQYNLLVSHACGTGNKVPDEIVRIMLLLKIQSLSYGHSGVDINTVESLIYFYNENILPVVYEQGSLGASGDLSPLAHLCIPLIGLGKVRIENEEIDATEINFTPIKLKSKEGLALLNGTQFMSAYGVYILNKAKQLSAWADMIAAISLEAFDGRIEPFHELIQRVRPHAGQMETAKIILAILVDSEIAKQTKTAVQDPYSFRCIPQVHGASKDVIKHVESVFETEINSVTDNPNVFPEEELIISGGNFHGQTLALALDYLALALAELGNISERRTYLLISGQRNLPPFLAKDAGLNSGMMIPQYTAASIVSQNKQLCSPASIDSIPSSNGQEDHVSMGANAATKCLKVLENLEKIIAIELLNASQALEFRRPLRSSTAIEKVLVAYRKTVSFNSTDRYLHEDIMKSIQFIQQHPTPIF